MTEQYGELADVYEFLVPEPMLGPEGAAAAFAEVTARIPRRGRVLDCACGTGELAVGLALQGFDVAASDASAAMVGRASGLAAEHGVALTAEARRWEDLTHEGEFDAVLCVGNSITHAADRRPALAAMARALRPGGLLALTSRNWEVPHEGLHVEWAERRGRRAAIAYAWWDDAFEVAVAIEGEAVHKERLTFTKFTHEELEADLAAVGLELLSSTWTPDAPRYLVLARR